MPVQALDRDNPIPLWAQLAADLRRRILAGDFSDRFPTDFELTAEYGVSRHTVREAVRRLEGDGFVERKQGSGTYLTARPIEQSIDDLYSLFRSVEASGLEQTSDVLDRREVVEPRVASVLGLEPAAPMLYLERLRLAGGEPLAVDRVHLPLPLAAPLFEADFGRTALYDELARRCGIAPDRGVERIAAVLPSGRDRRLLDLGAEVPALEVVRVTSSAGRPLEHRVTVIRSDRFSLRVSWHGGRPEAGAPAIVPRERIAGVTEWPDDERNG